jgi:hypothetical protein
MASTRFEASLNQRQGNLMAFMKTARTIMLGSAIMLASAAQAQQSAKVNPLDERGGLPVPETLLDLRNLSLTLWIKFRATNQQLYRYINETAQFHAYGQVCKRHELNLKMGPITKLSHHYIQATIPAHYEEPEFALLEPLGKTQQQAFLDDISGDIYGYEYGYRTFELQALIKQSDVSKKVYCEQVEKDYKLSYMALLATARNRLPDFESTLTER